MAELLRVEDSSKFRTYATGLLYCHVLALRINTGGLADVLVTDYTSNPEIASEKIQTPALESLPLRSDECLHLGIDLQRLTSLAGQYHHKFQEEIFSRLDASLSQSNWIDVAHRFVLARVGVRLQKKPTHLTGNVMNIALVEPRDDLGSFWTRFLVRVTPFMIQNPKMLLKVVQSLGPDALNAAGDVIALLSAKISVHSSADQENRVKIENDSDDELQAQSNLEPSQPAQQPSQSQFLTQLQDKSQSQISFSLESQVDIPFNDSVQGIHTLRELSKVPLIPNNRIYRTLAIVVAIPDLAYVCAKLYENRNGVLSLSDPRITALELVLADSEDRTLTPDNSISVHIPQEEVAEFFGISFPEQLYTRLPMLLGLFNRRTLRRMELELRIGEVDKLLVWTVKGLRFSQVCSGS